MIVRMIRGDSNRFEVTITSPQVGFNVALERVDFAVKKRLSDQLALIRKSTLDGGIVAVSANVVQVVLFREDTMALENINWIYPFAVVLTERTGDRTTVLAGELQIRRTL